LQDVASHIDLSGLEPWILIDWSADAGSPGIVVTL